MTDWSYTLGPLAADSHAQLAHLHPSVVPKGTTLFHPGDAATGFVVVLSGRIDVRLTGPSGREIVLYAVEPGQSCIQTTLGLMGDEPYSAEAQTVAETQLVLIPKSLFLTLMDRDAAFRALVLRAFARRMHDITDLLERVTFGRVESRLAAALLELAQVDLVHATHADLAARIGSAREVVSRRLESFARLGFVATERGLVRIR